jgi:hypothetical protein
MVSEVYGSVSDNLSPGQGLYHEYQISGKNATDTSRALREVLDSALVPPPAKSLFSCFPAMVPTSVLDPEQGG